MKKLTLMICITLFISNCEKNDDEITYPTCLQTYINTFLENNPSQRTPRSSIKKYMFNDNIVYLVDFLPNTPDSGTSVISSSCEPICSLGGIDGTQNDCDNWESAKYLETVWTDNR